MQTVKARFDGRVFIPEQPVELPVGSVVEFTLTQPVVTESPAIRTAADLYGITGGNCNISEEEIEAVKYRHPKWDGVSDIEGPA